MIGPALLGALAAATAAPLAVHPSFDCARAASHGERLVCRDPALAEADRDLAARYRNALAASPSPAALRLAQRDALAVRDACATRACVAGWYRARREALGPVPASRGAGHPPRAAPVPQTVGGCLQTRVKTVSPRLEGAPDSGAFLSYTDGLTQVSYDVVPGMRGSRPGDPVRLCLVSRPRGCPVGDTRGSVYSARNARTGARWTAADSSHQCGGA